MKTTRIILAALLLTACSVSAQAPAIPAPEKKYKPEEIRGVKNIDLADLGTVATKHEGQLVRLRFSFVTSEKPVQKDGETIVEIMHARDKAGAFYSGSVSAVIPMEAASWLASVPRERKRTGDEFVYARIVKPGKVELLGTKIVNGLKGSELSW